MLYTSLIVVHVLACVFLIAVVLLQTGKGADMGAVFGGSSETVFGSSGAGNFLTKLTTGVAALFMLTSLVMTYGSALQTTQSLFDDVPEDTSTQEGEATEAAPPVTDAEESPASEPQASAPPLTESSPAEAPAPASETQTPGAGEPQAEAPSTETPSS